jgi:hypothetical protein
MSSRKICPRGAALGSRQCRLVPAGAAVQQRREPVRADRVSQEGRGRARRCRAAEPTFRERAMPNQLKRRSAMIRDFDYDSSREKLYVTFGSGKTYVYDGVSRETVEQFAAAESKGAFFSENIEDRYARAAAASWPAGVRH